MSTSHTPQLGAGRASGQQHAERSAHGEIADAQRSPEEDSVHLEGDQSKQQRFGFLTTPLSGLWRVRVLSDLVPFLCRAANFLSAV